MELPLFISLRRKYGRLFHWSLENYVTTASLNTSSESAKFAICFLEYIDLVNFSLNTFTHVLLFFVVVVVFCFRFVLRFNTRHYCYFIM